MSDEKIIQILFAPSGYTRLGALIGLSSSGATYRVNSEGVWEPLIPPLGVDRTGQQQDNSDQ